MHKAGDSSIARYDEDYFHERDIVPSHLLDTILILLKKNRCKRILEVGVGSGRLMLALRSTGYEVEGIDISPVSAKLTGAKVASATDIPYPEKSFDCVIAVSIIEHITKAEGRVFISEANRVLQSGGTYFLVTPNYASPLRALKKDKWFGYDDETHVYFYTPHSLSMALIAGGFTQTRNTFQVNSDSMEWPLPQFLQKLPPFGRRAINKILISSPLAKYRDSFWVSATKERDISNIHKTTTELSE
jgi:SAM-dependent methyltransferase